MAKVDPNPLLEDDWETVSTGIGEEWDFDKKGQLIAVFHGTEFVDIPEDKQRDGRTRAMTYQFILPDTGEVVFVWESHQMTEAFKEIESGTLCRIQFEGYKKFDGSDGPRQVKQFKVSTKKS